MKVQQKLDQLLVLLNETKDADSTSDQHLLKEISETIEKVPLSIQILSRLLSKHFPHKTHSVQVIRRYCLVLLELAKRFQFMQQTVFDLLIDNCLIVDHDIQWDISRDDQSELSDSESDFSLIHSDNLDMSIKCDMFISETLKWISLVSNKNDTEALEQVFSCLQNSFKKTLLQTHKSKYTQFILFGAAALNPSFPDLLLGLLFETMMDQQQIISSRINAISYIASFCARAAYLEVDTVIACLRLLHTFASHFCQNFSFKSMTALKKECNSPQFQIFYNCIQAILYIFCFRYKQLLCDHDNVVHGAFPPYLSDLKQILTSSLHPLLFVTQSIALEFSRICHELEIMYAFPLFQTVKLGIAPNCDAYFPFDPVPQEWNSSDMIQPFYSSW